MTRPSYSLAFYKPDNVPPLNYTSLYPLLNKNGSSTEPFPLYAVFLTSSCVLSVLKASACLHLTSRLVYGLYFPGNPTCVRTSQPITASCRAISGLQKTTCFCHKPDNWIWRVVMFTTQAFTPPRGPSASWFTTSLDFKTKEGSCSKNNSVVAFFLLSWQPTQENFSKGIIKSLCFDFHYGRYSCSTMRKRRPYGQSVPAVCAVGTDQRPCVLQEHAVSSLWPVPLHTVKRHISKLSMLWH